MIGRLVMTTMMMMTMMMMTRMMWMMGMMRMTKMTMIMRTLTTVTKASTRLASRATPLRFAKLTWLSLHYNIILYHIILRWYFMILWQAKQLLLDLPNSPASENYHYVASDLEELETMMAFWSLLSISKRVHVVNSNMANWMMLIVTESPDEAWAMEA